MNDEEPITRRELDLKIENLSLEISSQLKTVLDEKFDKFQERFDTANITRRDQVILELTGFTYDQRERVVIAVQHAYKGAVSKQDTWAKAKAAFIGISVTAIFAWLIQNFKGD